MGTFAFFVSVFLLVQSMRLATRSPLIHLTRFRYTFMQILQISLMLLMSLNAVVCLIIYLSTRKTQSILFYLDQAFRTIQWSIYCLCSFKEFKVFGVSSGFLRQGWIILLVLHTLTITFRYIMNEHFDKQNVLCYYMIIHEGLLIILCKKQMQGLGLLIPLTKNRKEIEKQLRRLFPENTMINSQLNFSTQNGPNDYFDLIGSGTYSQNPFDHRKEVSNKTLIKVNKSGLMIQESKSHTFSGTYMEGTGDQSRMTMSRASHKKRIEKNTKVGDDFDINDSFRDDILVFGWRAKFIKDLKKVIKFQIMWRRDSSEPFQMTERTYHDFQILRKDLLLLFPNIDLPYLPARPSKNIVIKRDLLFTLRGLDQFMRYVSRINLLKTQEDLGTTVLYKFLENSHKMSSSTQNLKNAFSLLNPNPMMFKELNEIQIEVIKHKPVLIAGEEREFLDICLIDTDKNYSHVVQKSLEEVADFMREIKKVQRESMSYHEQSISTQIHQILEQTVADIIESKILDFFHQIIEQKDEATNRMLRVFLQIQRD